MPALIPLAIAGGTAVGLIGSAKLQSGAAGRAAKSQTDATNQAALLQDAAAKRSLSHLQHESFLDQVRSIAAAKGKYQADVASSRNLYNAAGDLSYNQRAEYLSSGRTTDKAYGARMDQMNYMRHLLGYGQPAGATSIFTEPDPLRQTELLIPTEQTYETPIDTSRG